MASFTPTAFATAMARMVLPLALVHTSCSSDEGARRPTCPPGNFADVETSGAS